MFFVRFFVRRFIIKRGVAEMMNNALAVQMFLFFE
jgi:hypothetical protein